MVDWSRVRGPETEHLVFMERVAGREVERAEKKDADKSQCFEARERRSEEMKDGEDA